MALFNTEKRKTAKLQRIRYVACDLDGTLLTSSNQISEATWQAIKDLQSIGVEPLLISGRSDGFIRKFAHALKLTTPVVSLNGLLISDAAQQPLFAASMRPGIGEIIDDLARNDANTAYSAFTPTGIYSQVVPQRLPRYLNAFPGEHKATETMNAAFDTAVMYVVQGRYGTVQNISVRIAKEFKDSIERIFYQSHQHQDLYYLEVKLRGIHKGTALRFFSRHFKAPAKTIAAIGDYANDLEMCRFAGVSAAVMNAISDLKREVDYVVRSTNDDDGAAEFFRLIIEAQSGQRA